MVRRYGVAFGSVALLIVLAWPAFAPRELDSFPVSNYPMFAHPRERVTDYYVVTLVDSDGEEQSLDLRIVGGTDQPVQAAMTVQQAVRRGESDSLCAEIAGRVDSSGRVEIARVTYDGPAWFGGDKDPIERVVHAECPAEGRS